MTLIVFQCMTPPHCRHRSEVSKPAVCPIARNRPRLERERVFAQLEHQAKLHASPLLLLGVEQEHTRAKVRPLQDVHLLPAEARVDAAVRFVSPDHICWIPV